MNGTHRTHAADSRTVAALNLLGPGLAQLHQGRTRTRLYFMVESVGLVATLLLAPTWWRMLLGSTVALVAGWAIADAMIVGRGATDSIRPPAG